MANAEHLQELRKGGNAWNQWRTDHHIECPDLKEAVLTRMDLRRMNLRDADLSNADLTGANLVEADLTGANLSSSNLNGVTSVFANFTDSNLTRANLVGAKLVGANLTRANKVGASLNGANLNGANLTRTNLTKVNLARVLSADDINWKDTIVIGTLLGRRQNLGHTELIVNLVERGAVYEGKDRILENMSDILQELQEISDMLPDPGQILTAAAAKDKTLFSGLFKNISKLLPSAVSASNKRHLDKFDISILHPARLAKGFSASIAVTIYLPEVRAEVDLKIRQRNELELRKELAERM